MRQGRATTAEDPHQKVKHLQEAIDDEPTDIPLGDNQAYGHVNMNRSN